LRGPQSQFPHSCVYSPNRSAYSAAGKYVDRSWGYINRSHIHECGTQAAQFLFSGYIYSKWNFRCSVQLVAELKNLLQVGGLLDSKGYGIATRPGTSGSTKRFCCRWAGCWTARGTGSPPGREHRSSRCWTRPS
jgi:hypothetical protein